MKFAWLSQIREQKKDNWSDYFPSENLWTETENKLKLRNCSSIRRESFGEP